MCRDQYRRIMQDHFPDEIRLSIGDCDLVYRKEIYHVRPEGGEPVAGGLRYGENPGQEAAIYRLVNGALALAGVEYMGPGDALVSSLGAGDPATAIMYGCGKHPSKTNLTDVDSGLSVLRYLADQPAAVIIKHNNPCGAAVGRTLKTAFQKAWAGDATAAFGGAAVVNRAVDRGTAMLMTSHYLEVVAAPEFEEGALEILLAKKDLRIFKIKNIERLGDYAARRFLDIKSLMDGGLVLQQSAVNAILTAEDFRPAEAVHQGLGYRAERRPTARELRDLVLGWAVEQGVTSNSALFVKNGATVAIGAGGQDRVGIVEAAAAKAWRNYADALCRQTHKMPYKDLELAVERKKASRLDLRDIDKATRQARGGLIGAVMVSDGFFPFRDGVDAALRQGVTAIAQPGGSLRDWESIEAVNQAKPPAAMVFTGQRAFKH